MSAETNRQPPDPPKCPTCGLPKSLIGRPAPGLCRCWSARSTPESRAAQGGPAAQELAVLMAEVRKAEDAARLEGLEQGQAEAKALAEVVNEAMELLGLEPGSTDEQFLDAIRERDRLRALVARQREALIERLAEAEISIPKDKPGRLPVWVARALELVDDPDGIASAEWLEAEREKAVEGRHDGCDCGHPLDHAPDCAYVRAVFPPQQRRTAAPEGEARLPSGVTAGADAWKKIERRGT